MRSGWSRRWGAVLALVLTTVLFLGALAPSQAGAAAKGTRREQMLELINSARVSHGIRRLSFDRQLNHFAKAHSRDMEKKNKLFHSDSVSRYLPRSWSTWGENVGVGVTVRGLHQAFMDSDGHRHNVLNRGFDHVGIGFVKSPEKGILWVTIVFYG
ncbi:MAG TPA: CAP domain-containing protein [Actinomycetota bacterium]|nr:CAP domain-containing protein [Actinomycetota bacterium]